MKPAHILIAEDDYAISLALKTILQKHINCHLTVVYNGQEAINALDGNVFDLVISDWNMPVKTGQQLLEHIRRHADTRYVPFIMLTARADKDSVINAAMCGVTDYIHKPFNREDLISKINRIIKADVNGPLATPANDAQTVVSDDDSMSAMLPDLEPARRKFVDLIVAKLKKEDFSFPTSPEIILSAIELIADPDSTLQEIADIIKKDALITTRLIAIANCSVYRGSKNYNTLEEAIKRIGMKETSNFLWLLANSPLFSSSNIIIQGLLTRVKQHALATAESAQIIARHLRLLNPAEYYYMGLLHDVGSVLILQILEDLDKEQPVQEFTSIVDAVKHLHHQFGAVLLKRWKLPDKIINVAQYHDTPEQCQSLQTELRVINCASFAARKLGFDITQEQGEVAEINEREILDLAAAKALNLDYECIIELKDRIPEYMRVMKNLL